MLTAVVVALMIPLIILIMYVVQANLTNAVEGTLTLSVTDYVFAAVANNTAQTLGQNYLYEDAGLTFNVTGLTEDVNYTVDWDAGTLTWTAYGTENSSDYAIDYEYFVDSHRLTFDDIDSSANDSYDMAGILPIAIIGIAVLSAIIGALAGFVLLRR